MSAGRRGGTATELLSLDVGELLATRTWSTGFDLLDSCLGGGLRGGELTVLGGAPGVGKTTLALQIARNIASAGSRVSYVCYEHTGQELLTRLLLMEAGLGYPDELPVTRPTRGAHSAPAWARPAARVRDRRCGRLRRPAAPGARRQLAGRRPGPGHRRGRAPAVLSSTTCRRCPAGSAATRWRPSGSTEVVERLKDHAMEHVVPVVAIVASDRNGLENARVRMQDLRGSTALAYEADVACCSTRRARRRAAPPRVLGPDSTKFQDHVSARWRRTGPGGRTSTSSCASGSRTGASTPEATLWPSGSSTAGLRRLTACGVTV